MVKVIVQHKVRNFETWKPVYESSTDIMKKHGGSNFDVGLVHGTKDDVIVTGDFDSEKNFKAFFSSEDLKNKMKESGVISEPKVTILEEKERG